MSAPKMPFVARMLERIAADAGVTVLIEPKWGHVGQIVGANGKRRYFRNTCFDLNPVGATEIAVDKDYANFFMREMGYPTVEGQAFFSDHWCRVLGSDQNIDAALDYAQCLAFPVIVKPNSRSQGVGVFKVIDKDEFVHAFQSVAEIDRVILVSRVAPGKDYRIVVLDDEILSAYERKPLSVLGDGVSSIRRLLEIKQERFLEEGRDTTIPMGDRRIETKLRRSGKTLDSVLERGQECALLDNANLSTGGDPCDVTDSIHPEYRALAIQLTADMGLRYCGVDLLVEDDITAPLGAYRVLEVNAAPGIDNYAASGERQAEIVDALYTKVLKAVAKL